VGVELFSVCCGRKCAVTYLNSYSFDNLSSPIENRMKVKCD